MAKSSILLLTEFFSENLSIRVNAAVKSRLKIVYIGEFPLIFLYQIDWNIILCIKYFEVL